MPEHRTIVEMWHRAQKAVRAHFDGLGLREVITPVRLEAVALEPFIEPIPTLDCLLATSPELPMKQLLARGSGSIYQIAPVFRRGEEGAQHREEFRLVEWYRVGAAPVDVRRDVEALVATVMAAVRPCVDGDVAPAPARWEVHGWLDVFGETTGVRLRGDEDDEALATALIRERPALWVAPPGLERLADPDARALLAWTAVFTTWSDRFLDPWLAKRDAGIHIVDFPAPLAALSTLRSSSLADRFESHVRGVELANGYRELTSCDEQAARFAAVAKLRNALGQDVLAEPTGFLDALREPGLPACSGAALGFDRLVALAAGTDDLRSIHPEF